MTFKVALRRRTKIVTSRRFLRASSHVAASENGHAQKTSPPEVADAHKTLPLAKACMPESLDEGSKYARLAHTPPCKWPENLPLAQKFAFVLQGNLRRNLREASFAAPGWFVYLKIENPQTH
ncbi:hypothetical protein [Paraburkholderia tropica]|uniref:hypothetical protein n=1 Tax=Paraburkholderia tropica TaxID=92647 RepID=UPI002AB7B5C9|nr:hypothetical protein [Paraburkholderia tropica]